MSYEVEFDTFFKWATEWVRKSKAKKKTKEA